MGYQPVHCSCLVSGPILEGLSVVVHRSASAGFVYVADAEAEAFVVPMVTIGLSGMVMPLLVRAEQENDRCRR